MPLNSYPMQDNFSTTLTQELNTTDLTINVSATPSFTFPASTTTYLTLNPGKSNQEVIEIESYDANANTITISASGRNISQGESVATTAQTHAVGSKAIISDNFKFWDDMKDTINGAANTADNNTWTGTNEFSDAVYFTTDDSDATLRIPNMTTAARDAISSPQNGMIIYNSTDGVNQQYYGGSWSTIDSGTPVGSATESVEGKVKLATLAEHDPATSGAVVVQAKNTINTPATYTPAFLTGGSNATAVVATWNAVTDGSVRITIDGTQRDMTGLDFSSDVDMDAVAATIQAGIRAVTSSTETCVWSTDHFVVTSANTTTNSTITVASAAGVGTDISGLGGTDFMDADTGNGTITDRVLNQAADEDKVVTLKSDGKIDPAMVGFIPTLLGDGSDGVLNVTSGTTNLSTNTVYNYSEVNISAGATLSTADTSGILEIRCNGTVTIDGTIDGNGKLEGTSVDGQNFRTYFVDLAPGTFGSAGDGGVGEHQSTGTNENAGGNGFNGYGGGGGGGSYNTSPDLIGGHGGDGSYPFGFGGENGGTNKGRTAGNGVASGGGAGCENSGGQGGNSYGADGSNGGGGNAGGGGGAGGERGRQGATIVIYARNFAGTGTIQSNGGDGQNGGNGGAATGSAGDGGGGGAGGGGAGGILCLIGLESSFGGTTSVAGGAGGSGGTSAGGTNGSAGTAGTAGTVLNTTLYEQMLTNIAPQSIAPNVKSGTTTTFVNQTDNVPFANTTIPKTTAAARVEGNGIHRVSFQLRRASGSGNVTGQVYINGVATGALRTTANTSYQTYAENFNLSKGDLIEVRCIDTSTSASAYGDTDNFLVQGDIDYSYQTFDFIN